MLLLDALEKMRWSVCWTLSKKSLRSQGKWAEVFSVSGSWEQTLNKLPLMLVISVYPWISPASLDFLFVPSVCQWWPGSTRSAAQLVSFIRIFYCSAHSGTTHNADVGPAVTGSHAVTGSLLEPSIKIPICFWLLAACSSSELGNSLSFVVLNCPFVAILEWKLEWACEEPRNRWGMDKLKDLVLSFSLQHRAKIAWKLTHPSLY